MANKQIRRKRRDSSPAADGAHGDASTSGSFSNGTIVIDSGESTEIDGGVTSATNNDGDGGDSDVIDPRTGYSDGTDTDTGTGTRRKRGPNKRSGTRSRKENTETTRSLSALLYSLHYMAATMMEAPEFAVTEEESDKLAAAVSKVTELYDVAIMGEKTAAWVGLAVAGGTIYGPRLIALNNRVKYEAANTARKVTVLKPQ